MLLQEKMILYYPGCAVGSGVYFSHSPPLVESVPMSALYMNVCNVVLVYLYGANERNRRTTVLDDELSNLTRCSVRRGRGRG